MKEEISDEDYIKIKTNLKRVHGNYFKEKSLTWNILNFISCSQWNHRWGRKYAQNDAIEKIYKTQLNEVWGRNKNLLSYCMKLKDDLRQSKMENNKLRQQIKNQPTPESDGRQL